VECGGLHGGDGGVMGENGRMEIGEKGGVRGELRGV